MADVLVFTSFSLYFSKSSSGGRGLWNDNALGAHRGSGMLCCCSGMCWRTAEVQNADPLFPSSSGFRSFPHSVPDCLPVCRVLVLIAVCHAIRHSVMPWLSMVLAFFSSFVFLSVFALLLNQLAQTWWFSSALVHTFPFPLRTPGTLFLKSWRWGVSEKGFKLLSSLRLQVWNDVQVVMKETWGSDLIWDFNNLQYVSNHAI